MANPSGRTTRAERRRKKRSDRHPAQNGQPPTSEELVPVKSPPMSDEEKEYQRLKDEFYASTTAILNTSKEKAADQFDKTVSAIATAALGFSFAVFGRLDQPEQWLAILALVVMLLFSGSLFSSLLSLLWTFHGVRAVQKRLDLWHAGDDSIHLTKKPWQDVGVVVLNWFSFGFLVAGVLVFVTVGFMHLQWSK